MKTRSLILKPWQARAAAENRLGLVVVPVKEIDASMGYKLVRQPIEEDVSPYWNSPSGKGARWLAIFDTGCGTHCGIECPLGAPGDRLCCREKWCLPYHGDLKNKNLRGLCDAIEYAADIGRERFPVGGNFIPQLKDFRWRSAGVMPMDDDFSRLTLELFSITVKPVQEITEDEARLAGVTCGIFEQHDGDMLLRDPICDGETGTYLDGFRFNWDCDHRKPPFRWQDNPQAWFGRVKKVEVPK